VGWGKADREDSTFVMEKVSNQKVFSGERRFSQPPNRPIPRCLGNYQSKQKCSTCSIIGICKFVTKNFIPKSDLIPILESVERLSKLSKGVPSHG
jgi:hypothetical protein